MKFILKIRPLAEHDLSSSFPFLAEQDDYDMYVQALSQDIAQLVGVLQVTQSNSCLVIETEEPKDLEELKKMIRPMFTETIMQNLRIVSLGKTPVDNEA